MGVELGTLLESIESLWPLEGADDWDAPGLVCGSRSVQVSRVLLTVDLTQEVISEAIDGAFDLIIAHHPPLLRGIKTMDESSSKGSLLSHAIRANIAIYAAHTNADIVETGVSACLAAAIGIDGSLPLVPTKNDFIGHGRIGSLVSATKLGEFARVIARVLPATASGVRVAGDFDTSVSRIALCAGAGDSFMEAAFVAGADAYVSSDLRHHPVQEILELAKAQGRSFAVIDIAHWAAEWLWLAQAAREIHDRFTSLQVVVSEIRTDPWDFAVTQ